MGLGFVLLLGVDVSDVAFVVVAEV
jgi:hypothetical protein